MFDIFVKNDEIVADQELISPGVERVRMEMSLKATQD